jgi:hypothetical protein
MLKKYLNVANGAMAVGIGSFVLAAYLGRDSTQSIWGPGGAPKWLALVASSFIFLSFWAYAKAKARSGWLGLLLPFLNIVGLIILLKLEDRSEMAPEIACAKCQGRNFAVDSTCRYCSAELQNGSI